MDNILREVIIGAISGTVVAVLNKASFDFHLKGSFNNKKEKKKSREH